MPLPKESDNALAACGAQAAAAGQPWHSNPYLRQDHAPRVTGESVCEWARKHDAWQRGFEGYDGGGAFAQLSAASSR